MDSETLACFWIQDSCSQVKGNGNKRRLTVDQVGLLEKSFNAENKLEHERKVRIAEETGLRPRQVAVWFQNRRARSKTKKIEFDFDSLSAEYEMLKNEFDSLFKLNHELKAEVDELREKWSASEKMKNPFEPVELEAMDSSVTELGRTKANAMSENLYKEDQGSRSSSKSDAFYSESPTMENQSQSDNLLQHELGYLKNEPSVDEFMDSFNAISSAVEDQSFCFLSY